MGSATYKYNPSTVEDVYRDFKGRRAGMIKALTVDVEDFFKQCDPAKENLCLYGFPNQQWEVNFPAEEVPPELPEPALGINFARDGMQERDWLSLVALHSDSWLLAVAYYFGARFGFDKNDRKRLYGMINELPTIFETINGKRQHIKRSPVRNGNHIISNSKTNTKLPQHVDMVQPRYHSKMVQVQPKEDSEEEEEEEIDEHADALCGACGHNYATDEFWICCDICERWFHGKCVKITPAKAQHIKHYKCPSCSSGSKRSRIQ